MDTAVEYKKIVQSKQDAATEKRTHESEKILKKVSEDKTIRRAQSEAGENSKEIPSSAQLESQARHLQKTESGLEGSKKQGVLPEIKHTEPRFRSYEQIKEYQQQAWDKLSETREGRQLIQQAGGKEKMIRMINDHRPNLLTRSAALCEKAGMDDGATGRNVHRVAELSTLEKHPKEILENSHQVEQRIDYIDRTGRNRHLELDDVTRLRDGRVVIRDYKPINLTNYERTSGGREWVKWAEKNVGADFREKIRNGASPFFNQEAREPMPKQVRSSLQEFLDKAVQRHRAQLEGYKDFYSKASGIDSRNIRTAIEPYFKF